MPRDASLTTSDTVSRPRLRACVILALAWLFVGTVATTLLVYGPFLWHVRQPAAWQGALEAALLTALIFAVLQGAALASGGADGVVAGSHRAVSAASPCRRRAADIVALSRRGGAAGCAGLAWLWRRCNAFGPVVAWPDRGGRDAFPAVVDGTGLRFRHAAGATAAGHRRAGATAVVALARSAIRRLAARCVSPRAPARTGLGRGADRNAGGAVRAQQHRVWLRRTLVRPAARSSSRR
jgi:hypothetical protein